VAVVHGAALGSGVEIAAACDFIVATPEAAFGTPEALRGTVGATQRLPRVLGKRLAKDLMFTNRRLTAAEARAAGLVSRVVPAAELEQELAAIGHAVTMASPEAIRHAKQCIDRGIELDPQGALGLELMAIEAHLASGKGMGKP
jgi:enoyl-CoA hydratase